MKVIKLYLQNSQIIDTRSIQIHPFIFYPSRLTQICVKLMKLTFEREPGCFGENSCTSEASTTAGARFKDIFVSTETPTPNLRLIDFIFISFQRYICFNKPPTINIHHPQSQTDGFHPVFKGIHLSAGPTIEKDPPLSISDRQRCSSSMLSSMYKCIVVVLNVKCRVSS